MEALSCRRNKKPLRFYGNGIPRHDIHCCSRPRAPGLEMVNIRCGQEDSKSAAVAAAEKAIDRALAMKKVRLVPPVDRD
jgi:hypothetical protein